VSVSSGTGSPGQSRTKGRKTVIVVVVVTVPLLIYFCDRFVASEIHHSRRHCSVFVNNQRGIQRQGQDFDIKFVFDGVHSKEVDRRISRSKLFKTLRDKGTVNRQPGSGKPCSAHTEENATLLLQKFPQSATDFVLPIVR